MDTRTRVKGSGSGSDSGSGGDFKNTKVINSNNIVERKMIPYFNKPGVVLKGHDDRARRVAISCVESIIASCSWDNDVRLWRNEGGRGGGWKEWKKLKGHNSAIICIVFVQKDDEILLSGSYDHTIICWRVCNGEKAHVFQGHENSVLGITVLAHGNLFASGSLDKTMRIWDWSTGKQVAKVDTGEYCHSIACSPDNNHIATGHVYPNDVMIWDVSAISAAHPNIIHKIKTLSNHTQWVSSVCYSSDGRFLASASGDHRINIYTCQDNSYSLLRTLKGHSDAIRSIAFIYKTDWLVSASNDKTVRIWDAETGIFEKTDTTHDSGVTSVAVSRTGKYIVSGCNADIIIIHERDAVVDEDDTEELFGHIKNAANTS